MRAAEVSPLCARWRAIHSRLRPKQIPLFTSWSLGNSRWIGRRCLKGATHWLSNAAIPVPLPSKCLPAAGIGAAARHSAG